MKLMLQSKYKMGDSSMSNYRLRGQYPKRAAKLMCGSALAATAMFCATVAQAQNSNTAIEEVVVTGTSIRGVAPVGSNLITIDQAAIEATGAQNIQQLLSSTP